ncbi:MAG TPA: heparan-alpha-glucosaminide N-acetyltransferase domain-containing protein [Gemmatimonadaceae bacterium]|nr:heparan-alpha-glucosaminide N-acetyltransferase domain-containing protein [Gemmatimonadaceae bacterium]
MTAPPTKPLRQRVESVDVVRGVIMIIMALDHTRDFFGNAAANPTNLATASAGLFLTRWITHFSAPTFFFLSGLGAYLALRRRTKSQLSVFLLTRGLWLVFLDAVLFRFLLQFNVDYHVTILTVLWALGWSMVALAALSLLPTRIVAIIGAIMIFGHNLLDPIKAQSFGSWAPLWNVLHSPGLLYMSPGHLVIVAYPLIPWIGVMALGYGIGPIYSMDPARRRALLLRAGIAVTALFLILRASNFYGDPAKWSAQKSGLFTALSFLNTTKYPPSLLFLAMTLGPVLVLLSLVDARTPRFLRPALTIGKVPMFYYLLHFTVLHLLAILTALVRFGGVHWMFESPTPDKYPITQPPGWPASLPVVYLYWIAVVLLVYPACKWYAGVKSRSNNPWLSYL